MRDGALNMARRIYPGASDQRLVETLLVYTQYPLGDVASWKRELLAQKAAAATVFPP